jgi:hypothetical protein
MSNPWDSDEKGHNIVQDGELVRCTKCDKRATAERKLGQTRCNTDDDRRVGRP